MQGYQLSFFTQQDHFYHGRPLAEWLLEEARRMGIRGATRFAASEGFGQHRRLHAAHFFELTDQPEEVTMIVSADEADQLLAHLQASQVRVLYCKVAVEFGVLGENTGANDIKAG